MGDRHADLAHFAPRQEMIAVVPRLGREIEGDGKPRLALVQIAAIELVGLRRGGMAGIGSEKPGLVGHGGREARPLLQRNRPGESASRIAPGSRSIFYATDFRIFGSLPLNISSIWFSLTIKGGDSARVSPEMRIMKPWSWKAFSMAL
jgi:hypothetical protein